MKRPVFTNQKEFNSVWGRKLAKRGLAILYAGLIPCTYYYAQITYYGYITKEGSKRLRQIYDICLMRTARILGAECKLVTACSPLKTVDMIG
ncbi:MAG TPA: hypothetical protein ACFYD2_03880 [Candidatus Avalokitesvara rifleensis]|uniref:hypothetical protein n=1 Tax=Candidatus Avalokitesvara rifleensis TaxID=3367620 RepID=UPI0027125477|nr:hypothetical protein [Candidatus Brocadiales bacterium]